MALGLRQMLGDEAFYRRMLSRFAFAQADVVVRVEAALAADWGAAEREAHTLRGLAGSIGATALQEEAGRLEVAIRQRWPRSDINALLSAAQALLEPLLAALSAQLGGTAQYGAAAPPAAGTAEVVLDTEAFKAVCTQLADLLADSDPQAVDLWQDHAPLLFAALTPAYFGAIAQALGAYDFELALDVLNRATAEAA